MNIYYYYNLSSVLDQYLKQMGQYFGLYQTES